MDDLNKFDNIILSQKALDTKALNIQSVEKELNVKILDNLRPKSLDLSLEEFKKLITQQQLNQIEKVVLEIIAYNKENFLYPDEIEEINRLAKECGDAIRIAEESVNKGTNLLILARTAAVTAGGLVADDITGIGLVDDVLIPFFIIAAGSFALAHQIISTAPEDIAKLYKDAEEKVSKTLITIEQVLTLLRNGKGIQSDTENIVIHLARMLGSPVAGKPPDKPDPQNQNKKNWWREIKAFIGNIRKVGLTENQLNRELFRKNRFTPEMIEEIKQALKKAAELMGEEPPIFPPI